MSLKNKKIYGPSKNPPSISSPLSIYYYVKYGHLNIYSFDHLLIFLPTDTVENILKLELKREKNSVHVLTEISH